MDKTIKDFNIDELAIITIREGMVHLWTTWNPDASCCQDDETGDIVQTEEYDSDGWNEPQSNPRLKTEFWDVWTEWNGKMVGGITLYDDTKKDDAYEEMLNHSFVSPEDIAHLPDGVYTVGARID